jgi:hypothetical protein
MGKEIKIICTVVPNTHKTDEKNFYFSLFLTPKLQFDGKLHEYFEMENWFDFCDIFENPNNINLNNIEIKHDSIRVNEILKNCGFQLNFLDKIFKKNDVKTKPELEELRKELWQTLFPPETPVVAWPIWNIPTKIEYPASNPNDGDKGQVTQNSTALVVKNSDNGTSVPKGPAQENIQTKKREIKEKNRITIREFHSKISQLSSTPDILRLLGLIFDYKVPKNDNIKSLNFLQIKFSDTQNKSTDSTKNIRQQEFDNSVEFICPKTLIEILKDSWQAKPYVIEKVVYSDFVNHGFVNSDQIEVTQDYDEGGTQNFTAQQDLINEQEFKDIQNLNAIYKTESSKGISIKLKALSNKVFTESFLSGIINMTGNTDFNTAEIYQHHLDCGYRIDVRNDGGKWLSLCKRKATFRAKSNNNELNIEVEDEPWLEEILQVSDNGSSSGQNISTEIARWNNWSVVCPPITYAFSEEYDQLHNLSNFYIDSITPKELPKLRFGKEYEFRIRTVDICGNGPSSESEDADIKNFAKFTYCRKEPINAPLLIPTYELYKENTLNNDKEVDQSVHLPNKQHLGESDNILVIRHQVNELGKIGKAINDSCIRLVSPPQVTINFAEVCGGFDVLFKDPERVIKEKAFFINKAESFYNETTKKIPFVHDPYATGVKLDDKEKNKAWTNSIVDNKFYQLKLLQNLNDNKVDTSDGGIEVHIKPGCIEAKDISCLKSNKEIKTLPAEGHLKSNEKIKPLVAKVHFVSAVQRPILIDNSATFNIKLNPKGKSSEYIFEVKEDPSRVTLKKDIFEGTFPMETVSEFTLVGTYQDIYWLKGIKNKGDMKFVSATYSNLKQDSSSDELLAVNLGENKENDVSNLFNKANFSQQFPDNKYRIVNYTLFAKSKFSHFFDISQLERSNGIMDKIGNFFKSNKEQDEIGYFSIKQELGLFIVPNRSKPSKPNITDIVPLITWRENGKSKTRLNDTFRVYLGPNWYETGDGEKIAVIISTKSIDTHDNPLDKREFVLPDNVTTYGSDPILDTVTKFASIFPRGSYNQFGKEDNALIYNVKFDDAKSEYYVDIIVNDNINEYMPFFKFAICRYQEYSLPDFKYSEIVLSSQVQMLPKRTVTKDGNKLTFQNHGQRNPKNELYLIADKECIKVEKDFVLTDVFNSKISIDLNKIKTDSFNLPKEGKDIYLEEYECFDRGAKFSIENPRNDETKRLIFQYKIR